MKYKCIIFDCDGVLVDSEAISIGILVDMSKELDLHLDLSEAIDLFSGTSLQNCFDYITEKSGKSIPEDFEARYRKESFRRFESELKLVEGIKEVIDQLDIPFCVASSGPVDKIIFNLTNTNMIHHFSGKVYSAYTIGKWKPDPAIFLHAASEMGFLPSESAVIEDSIAGVQAGVSGGFDTYAISHGPNAEALRSHGAKVFSHMKELLEILQKA